MSILRLRSKALVGMVHAEALPTAPKSRRAVADIVSSVVAQARTLRDSGFDAVLIENMHDAPYVQPPHDPAIVAAMTSCVLQVRDALGESVPLGVQILSCGEREALAVALAAGAEFIRCENFVYAHIADEGLLERAAAGPLLRYRRMIGAEHVSIICDIKKKHAAHALTADLSLADVAHAAEFFGADGLVVSGAFTGAPTDPNDVSSAKAASSLPVLVGSGVTPPQITTLFRHADALIVGSYIKEGGVWSNGVEPTRCRQIVQAAEAVRP